MNLPGAGTPAPGIHMEIVVLGVYLMILAAAWWGQE